MACIATELFGVITVALEFSVNSEHRLKICVVKWVWL